MRKLILGALGTLLVVGCGDDSPSNTTPDAAIDSCTTRITATGNVTDTTQAALIAARAGDVICFADGTYSFTEELSLTVDGVTLRGNPADRTKVVFDFSGQGSGNPNAIHAQGVDDFVIEGMVIKDALGDGLRITNGTNITIRKLNVIWTSGRSRGAGAYGVYPVECNKTLIDDVEVRGASDAGIYIGQSTVAVVRNSRAEGNVAGLEIENTDNAEVYNNVTVGNVTGILVFVGPNLVRKTGSGVLVHDNIIMNNNIESFAEGGLVSFLPSGAGFLMFSNDKVEVRNNTITGNKSTAIVLTSCSTVALISDNTVNCNDPQYDGFLEGVYVHDNTITGNGSDPDGAYGLLAANAGQDPFYDILWDGVVDSSKPANAANKVCIKNNGTATYGKVDVTTLGAVHSSNAAEVDCTQPAVPGVQVTW